MKVIVRIVIVIKRSDMEQSYKEKYEQAIERLKQWDREHPCAGYVLSDRDKFIFPELAENKDERIKKRITLCLEECVHSDVIRDYEKDEYVAWLERQGEKKASCTTIVETGDGGINALVTRELPTDGKQNPTDKVEPKFKVKYAGGEYNVLEIKEIAGVTYYGIEDEPNHIDYVLPDNCEVIGGFGIKENGLSHPTKPAMFSEKKTQRMVSAEAKEAMYDKPTVWSEEDEKMMAAIEHHLNNCGASITSILWLKSLKDRVGCEANCTTTKEWSEEDETVLNNLIYALANDRIGNNRDEYVDWLKSLRPQNRWKPSDEQMEILLQAVAYFGVSWANKDYLALQSLYFDLKKLEGK